jgi:hypothetical protein
MGVGVGLRIVPYAAALACVAAACGAPGNAGRAQGGASAIPDAAPAQIDAADDATNDDADTDDGARDEASAQGDDASDGAPPERPFLELDCRPHVQEVAQFESRCQIVSHNPTTMKCESRNGQSGNFFMYVHRPDDAIAGVLLPLSGTDPVVTVAVGVELSANLVQSREGGSGFVLFDSFGGGRFMRGRFLVASIQTAQSPGFSCTISEQQFVAE